MSVETKRCSKCGEEFPATTEYFHRNSSGKNGLCGRCKACKCEDVQSWYKGNSEKKRKNQRVYYEKTRDQRIAYAKEYYGDPENKERKEAYRRANHEYLLQKEREWYQANREHKANYRRKWIKANRARRQIYIQEWKKNNPDYDKEWRKNNPDKVRANRHNRRAREQAAGGFFTEQDIKRSYNAQKGRCYYCGASLETGYHADHYIPLSQGGNNDAGNIVLACPSCNFSKGAKMPGDWLIEKGMLL